MSERLFLDDLDPSTDIDLSNVPKSVLELVLETTSATKVPRLSIKNVPLDLTLLEFRPLLSSSLTEPFYLPITLRSYRGPVLSGMKLPPNLENLALVESSKSLQMADVFLPPLLKVVVAENPMKFSNLDSTKLPPSVESFQIIGKYNCSLEKLVFPPSVISVDIGKSTQPVDLLSTRAKIVQETTFKTQGTKPTPEVVTATNPEFSETLGELRKSFPRLDKLHVILDDKILTSVGDVWTEVLLEGRVQVRELTITNTLPTNSCLGDCGEVFKRSRRLGRKLCRKLIVVSEKYSHASHLNLAMSLKLVGGISLEVSYADQVPSECLLPRFAEKLGLSKDSSGILNKYVSDSFGAMTTSVQISEDKLVVVVGESPKVYEKPKPPQPLVVPVAASALQPAVLPRPQEPKTPHHRPIVLYTWKTCGFCQKQEAVIEEFKKTSLENTTKFNDKVDVKVLENPHDVPDKRVDSFPTWVKNNNLIVGVQSVEQLTTLLE